MRAYLIVSLWETVNIRCTISTKKVKRTRFFALLNPNPFTSTPHGTYQRRKIARISFLHINCRRIIHGIIGTLSNSQANSRNEFRSRQVSEIRLQREREEKKKKKRILLARFLLFYINSLSLSFTLSFPYTAHNNNNNSSFLLSSGSKREGKRRRAEFKK
jgi:hypothetical protein